MSCEQMLYLGGCENIVIWLSLLFYYILFLFLHDSYESVPGHFFVIWAEHLSLNSFYFKLKYTDLDKMGLLGY